jgi:hypothetical protein
MFCALLYWGDQMQVILGNSRLVLGCWALMQYLYFINTHNLTAIHTRDVRPMMTISTFISAAELNFSILRSNYCGSFI